MGQEIENAVEILTENGYKIKEPRDKIFIVRQGGRVKMLRKLENLRKNGEKIQYSELKLRNLEWRELL